jgi:hypothetical protein
MEGQKVLLFLGFRLLSQCVSFRMARIFRSLFFLLALV